MLAREHGKTVITSIHQPSSAVFRSFDRLMLLSEGKIVYFGTPVASLQYLRLHNLACPDGYNAADHWMDLLVQDSAMEDEDDSSDLELGPSSAANEMSETLRKRKCERSSGRETVPPRLILEEAWDGEAVAEQMEREVNGTDATADSPDDSPLLQLGSKYSTNWWTQYLILTHRALKNSRSAIFTPLNLCKSLAIGLVAGLLWFRTDYTEGNVYDISSCKF